MKRLLRVCLLVILAVGLFLIIRRELGVLSSSSDYADAAQIAGIPSIPSSVTLRPARPDVPDGEPLPAQDAQPSRPDGEPPPAQDARPSQPEEAVVTVLADVDLEALREVNGDVVGWIMIPGTTISYPLMQGADNDYYLKHTWSRRYSTGGAVFLESANSRDLTDFNTIIYGHNMRSGSMFGSLKYYSGADYWREHPGVYVVTDDAVLRYDIFSAGKAGVQSVVYRLDIEKNHLEEEFLQYCTENSAIDTGIVPEAGDRILTLSTCTGNGYADRWVVLAVLEEEFPRGTPGQDASAPGAAE